MSLIKQLHDDSNLFDRIYNRANTIRSEAYRDRPNLATLAGEIMDMIETYWQEQEIENREIPPPSPSQTW